MVEKCVSSCGVWRVAEMKRFLSTQLKIVENNHLDSQPMITGSCWYSQCHIQSAASFINPGSHRWHIARIHHTCTSAKISSLGRTVCPNFFSGASTNLWLKKKLFLLIKTSPVHQLHPQKRCLRVLCMPENTPDVSFLRVSSSSTTWTLPSPSRMPLTRSTSH